MTIDSFLAPEGSSENWLDERTSPVLVRRGSNSYKALFGHVIRPGTAVTLYIWKEGKMHQSVFYAVDHHNLEPTIDSGMRMPADMLLHGKWSVDPRENLSQ